MKRYREFITELKTIPQTVLALRNASKPAHDGVAIYEPHQEPRKIESSRYNKKYADEANAAYNDWHYKRKARLFNKGPFGELSPEQHKEQIRPYKHRLMRLSDLHHSQPSTHATDRVKLAQKATLKAQRNHIRVVSHTNSDGVRRHFVVDGHHALAAANARGRGVVRVLHMDLDKATKQENSK